MAYPSLAIDIAADHLLADLLVQTGMISLKLTGKLRDALNNDTKSCQRPHRRTKGRRIHALVAGIDRESLHQPIRQTPEQQFIETLFDKQTAIVAQGFLTEIAVRFAAHVQGIVPHHIEGQGLDGLCIAQIVQLLQKQDPDDNV